VNKHTNWVWDLQPVVYLQIRTTTLAQKIGGKSKQCGETV